METLILTQANVVPDGLNSTYRYTFPRNVDLGDYKVGVSNVNIFYSWQNINAGYGNNTFSYTYPNGASTTTYSVTIPNGNYEILDLNNFLEYELIQNGNYLIDNNGNYVYYLNFQVNQTAYAIQFNSIPVPTVLPAGWSIPAGGSALPTGTNYNPQLIILNGLGSVIGFANGTFPTVTSGNVNYSINSTSTPSVNTVSSVLITSDMCYNSLAGNNNVMYAFTPQNVTFGSNIYISVAPPLFIKCASGSRNSFDIVFRDQNFQPMKILDSDITVVLTLSKL